jgi:hypothetical protein
VPGRLRRAAVVRIDGDAGMIDDERDRELDHVMPDCSGKLRELLDDLQLLLVRRAVHVEAPRVARPRWVRRPPPRATGRKASRRKRV